MCRCTAAQAAGWLHRCVVHVSLTWPRHAPGRCSHLRCTAVYSGRGLPGQRQRVRRTHCSRCTHVDGLNPGGSSGVKPDVEEGAGLGAASVMSFRSDRLSRHSTASTAASSRSSLFSRWSLLLASERSSGVSSGSFVNNAIDESGVNLTPDYAYTGARTPWARSAPHKCDPIPLCTPFPTLCVSTSCASPRPCALACALPTHDPEPPTHALSCTRQPVRSHETTLHSDPAGSNVSCFLPGTLKCDNYRCDN